MSAAMQTAPQQTPAQDISNPYNASSTSSPRSHHARRHSTTTSQQVNYSLQPPNVPPQPPQPSSRHPGRQLSPNGYYSAGSPLDFQQPLFPSVPTSPPAMSSSRQQPPPPSTHASPVSPTAAPSSGHNRNRSNAPDPLGTPPIPPRTSSTQRSRHNSTTSSAPGSRNSKHSAEHRREQSDRERSTNGRDKTMDDPSGGGGRSRRKGQQPSEGSSRTSNTKETRDQPSASADRLDPTTTSDAVHGTLVKESSTIINQVVLSDPAVDLERENERQLEAATSSSGSGRTPVTGLGLVGSEGVDDGGRGGLRSRHDYSSNGPRRKETTFGQYILGQTLGEGEFGKVKLGWKRDGSIQVAIKLIRRETLGSNPSRLPKIYREISILRDLSHPNIVRLHEMVETDRHIGIIMEYASGGELFDHILNNRYLKDNAARRLFAQLVSGVGYLHKKGIVHRDLKLENLLLDRNRNIIITDFGFANTFNPNDELGEEIEYNLTNREFVKRMRLDKPDANGMRRGDLMQTSCGSPCYAAPELVVSDSLYTGRKVDVWSCGVILYAMLAGYLPFDDDPANPEGDNINLLYKYIVTTPLTFPEYVTPHARDLLRRILVPDPRKRADLFEVARHSWLSEYSHIVSHVTSNTTNLSDIANTTVPPEDPQEGPALTRSASVREPPKSYQTTAPPLGGLSHQQGKISPDEQAEKEKAKVQRDAKRRTVQVEYVAPQSQTARGDAPATTAPAGVSTQTGPSRTRGPTGSVRGSADRSGPVASDQNKPLPETPVASGAGSTYPKAPTSGQAQGPSAASGNIPRSTSDTTGPVVGTQGAAPQNTRPTTGGSIGSANHGRLPSRGSYGQPVAPTVAATTAQGRLAQPKNGKQYVISAPIPQQPEDSTQQSTQQVPSKPTVAAAHDPPPKGHKRSNTVTGISEKLFGRSGSIFAGRGGQSGSRSKPAKRYPPTSMKDPYPNDDSRTSVESRRSVSFGRKQSNGEQDGRPRRFSLLPPSFSLKGFSSGNKEVPNEESQMVQGNDSARTLDSHGQPRPSTGGPAPNPNRRMSYGTYDSSGAGQEGSGADSTSQIDPMNYEAQIDRQFAELHGRQHGPYQHEPYSNPSVEQGYQSRTQTPTFQEGYNSTTEDIPKVGRSGRVLQKNNRKFADAYEYERDLSHHSGSSGAARKVMDFFRRRGKARVGDDR